MKELAILLMAHRDVDLINRLISHLQHPEIDIYIHIDKKSQFLVDSIVPFQNTSILSENESYDVHWGQNQDNRAAIALINCSIGKYNHYALISGQHYLLKNAESIVDELKKAPEADFISIMPRDSPIYNSFIGRSVLYWPECLIGRNPLQKGISYTYRSVSKALGYPLRRNRGYHSSDSFMFGSQWWILSANTIDHIYNKIHNDPKILDYYDNSFCPDECIFQTLVNECSESHVVNDNLTYIDWSEGKASPKLLTKDDYSLLERSNCLFARKFDSIASKELLDRIDQNLLQA
ncbi:beta-1,6-N-acetylglucosaminyltransferase [Collinsella sp. LCP21S3_E4]|uniref:beta-1,6-N-acetylglucosaminyltransferase n=1 Tax=Collinsella sp. LCP21S3_E4 TaxID=3438774 RepID=UPI003F9320A8